MKDLVKAEAGGAITLAAFRTDLIQIQEAMQANIGPQGVTELDFPHIKVPAGGAREWTVNTLQGEAQVPSLEGAVIAWRDGRAYYKTKYGEGEGNKPPDCFSNDAIKGTGYPGGICANCPLAQFGSGENNSQACRAFRSLFIVRGDNMLPEVLTVPPTSVKLHKKFNMMLSSFGKPYFGVMVNFTLTPVKNTKGIKYSEVSFGIARELTSEEYVKAKEYAQMFGPLIAASTKVMEGSAAEAGRAPDAPLKGLPDLPVSKGI